MAQPDSPNRAKKEFDPQLYARLKAEAAAPYRSFRKFIYFTCAASGFIGAFIFFLQLIAGRNIDNALPNLAVQIGVIALMIFLWRLERHS
ncbi:MAG: DUF3493 domain-containing protein [Calothrix sp. SM1_7_51]|nr:DUF3493 domain-containing protein [Calothrix sp. SM1_7_51]